jgi:tripartite-type tricarboxylate transporter receptor subunit TctC
MHKRLLLGLIALIGLQTTVMAQEWPDKQPIHTIVSNTPGSALDIVARIVLERVSQQIGQSIVVENRPGAANTIGIAAVAKAAPDGYTILVTTSAIAIAPHTHKTLPYDTLRDLRTVSALGNLANVMMVPAERFESLKDFIAKAKAKPNALLYASLGPGSTGHLSAERLGFSAGFSAVQVPFKGAPEGLQELAAGRVDFFYTPVIPAMALINQKKIIPLAIGSSVRSSLLPDVPTTLEAGYPNSDYNFWIGLFVPAATPQPIVARLHEEIRKALQTAEIKSRLAKLGVEPMNMTLEQFDAYFKQEIELNAKLVKAANISTQ